MTWRGCSGKSRSSTNDPLIKNRVPRGVLFLLLSSNKCPLPAPNSPHLAHYEITAPLGKGGMGEILQDLSSVTF